MRAATKILSGSDVSLAGKTDHQESHAATAANLSSINCTSTVMSMQNQIKVIARSTSYAPHMSLIRNGGLSLK